MSLRSHFADKNSPIRQFLAIQFPNSRAFLREARRKVRLADTILPNPPDSDVHIPWTTIGMALHYRIRYYFGITPSDEMAAYHGSLRISPTKEFVAYSSRRMYLGEITAKDYGCVYLSPTTVLTYDKRERKVIFSKVLPGRRAYRDFFLQLDTLLEDIQPRGRKLGEVKEDALNRYCFVLGLFEQMYRARTWTYSPLIDNGFEGVEELLGIPDTYCITDLRELSWKFYDNFNHLLSLTPIIPSSYVNQGFGSGVGGAEADLIADDTLIDIKVSKKSRIPTEWLWQLLSYALLDYRDEFWIRGIGFYMARQELLIKWSIEEVLECQCKVQSPTIEDWFAVRERFKEVVERL